MLILSRVCAEFHDRNGAKIFSVTPDTRLSFQEAPDAIQQDPLFQMLINDGSMEVTTSLVRRKQLENDPEAAPAAEEKKPAPKAKAKAESQISPHDPE